MKTDPNKPVSEMTVREMFALEIAAQMCTDIKSVTNSFAGADMAKAALRAADALIEELNKGESNDNA